MTALALTAFGLALCVRGFLGAAFGQQDRRDVLLLAAGGLLSLAGDVLDRLWPLAAVMVALIVTGAALWWRARRIAARPVAGCGR